MSGEYFHPARPAAPRSSPPDAMVPVYRYLSHRRCHFSMAAAASRRDESECRPRRCDESVEGGRVDGGAVATRCVTQPSRFRSHTSLSALKAPLALCASPHSHLAASSVLLLTPCICRSWCGGLTLVPATAGAGPHEPVQEVACSARRCGIQFGDTPFAKARESRRPQSSSACARPSARLWRVGGALRWRGAVGGAVGGSGQRNGEHANALQDRYY